MFFRYYNMKVLCTFMIVCLCAKGFVPETVIHITKQAGQAEQ